MYGGRSLISPNCLLPLQGVEQPVEPGVEVLVQGKRISVSEMQGQRDLCSEYRRDSFAELPLGARAPAVRGPGRGDSTGVIAAGTDPRERDSAADRIRRRAARGEGALAEGDLDELTRRAKAFIAEVKKGRVCVPPAEKHLKYYRKSLANYEAFLNESEKTKSLKETAEFLQPQFGGEGVAFKLKEGLFIGRKEF